jgi:hypothetical protein
LFNTLCEFQIKRLTEHIESEVSILNSEATVRTHILLTPVAATPESPASPQN